LALRPVLRLVNFDSRKIRRGGGGSLAGFEPADTSSAANLETRLGDGKRGLEMKEQTELGCTICGEPHSGERRFLIVEDRWQDKLKILHWDDRLAAIPGVHAACSAGHLQQLVVHWMATGSIDHPFARAAYNPEDFPRRRSPRPRMEPFEGDGVRQIGELTVHRESMQRVLNESPASMQTILDALLSALQRDVPRPEPERQWDGVASPAGERAI